MDPRELKHRLPTTAFAFRGYNVTNLGRTPELLAHARFGAVVAECLEKASRVCAEVTARPVDLIARVQRREETSLDSYAEAVALVMAVEDAQIRLLKEFFDIDPRRAELVMGYSLGEVTAVALAGVMDLYQAMRVPLALSDDCVALSRDVTLGVLFSRGRLLPAEQVRKLCLRVNEEGRGVIGVSAHLSPNSFLLMGQGDTLDRFKAGMAAMPGNPHLRKNESQFPPLHTPIVWQRNIPNRAGVLMQTLPMPFAAPHPPVLSLVTGQCGYNDHNARELLQKWTDHPQLLWNAVYETLRAGVELIVHVGPEPNIIPATYKRLKDNVESETRGKIGMRALTAVVHRPWLKPLLPERTALLRAPRVRHLILEDWLLEQPR